MMKPAKNTICLWYDGGAEDAARFYAKTFPDSSVDAVHSAPGDEEDRHRCNRGDAPRLTLLSSKRACPSIEVIPRPRIGVPGRPSLSALVR